MSVLAFDRDDADEDLRAEARAERRRNARLWHWCEDCHGHRGGPCDFGDEPPTDPDEENSDA